MSLQFYGRAIALVLMLSVSSERLVLAQPVVQPAGPDGSEFEVVFRFKPETDSLPGSVHIAGDFNNWSTTATPMRATTASVYAARVQLPKGEYAYKYVIDGNQWASDAANLLSADDGVGGVNSIVAVGVEPQEPGLPKSVRAEPVGDGKYRVTFTHEAPGAKQVFLAGQFNHWNSEKDAMVELTPGKFSLTVTLEEGEIPYKFVVDGAWQPDPLNPEGADDNNSGLNSILRLGAAAQVQVSTEKVGDDSVFVKGLKHEPKSILFFNPMEDGSVVVKLQAMAHDVKAAGVAGGISGNTSGAVKMASEYSDDRMEIFRAELPWKNQGNDAANSTESVNLQYNMHASDGSFRATMGGDGITTASSDAASTTNTFARQIDPDDIFVTPDWARDVVWYQIFPERFRNGSTANDPHSSTTTVRSWTSDWWTQEANEPGRAMEPGVFGRRYGGDLQGIIEKLPYLKELGVGAIYLNPVFEAESLHKYETTDYRHIDDNFGFAGDYEATAAQEDLLDPATWKFSGTDQLFLELLEKAHAAGLKVIIDGVFNHTGTWHPAFQDVKKNGQASRFADWYNVTSWTPFDYEGWAGEKGLPVFKEEGDAFADQSLHRHLFDITRRWMDPNGDGDPSDGIDGWRLDVPNEVSSKWWSEWRELVKSINPDAVIIGEIWDPPAKWLMGDQFDSVMNYQLAQALTRFFTNGGKATELRQDVSKLLSSVPDQSIYAMMNLMDSHDTDRLVSQLNNPGRGYDAKNRQQELTTGTYSSEKPAPEVYQRMKQLAAVQFALVGSPMIYYGDEAGMWGADDPENRKPMLWKDLEPYQAPEQNHFMADVHAHFQRLAAIRNSYKVLQTGDYKALAADDAARVFAFVRHTDQGSILVVTNDSDKAQEVQVPLEDIGNVPQAYVELINDPAVTVVPGAINGPTEMRVAISDKATKIPVRNRKLEIRLEPHTTGIYLGMK